MDHETWEMFVKKKDYNCNTDKTFLFDLFNWLKFKKTLFIFLSAFDYVQIDVDFDSCLKWIDFDPGLNWIVGNKYFG